MKLRKLLIIAIALSLPAISWGADLFVGDKAANFTLKSNKGENLRLSEQRGQVVLLTFWATWCGSCKQQLKDFEILYNEHRDKGFQIWAIGMDEDLKEVAFHSQKLGFSFPALYDTEHQVAKAYQIDDIPSVVLIDRDGTIRYLKEEYKSKYLKEYKDQVNKLVNE